MCKGLYGQIRTFIGHTGDIRSLAVSKDGKRILSGGMDHNVILWDADTGKEIQAVQGPHRLDVVGRLLARREEGPLLRRHRRHDAPVGRRRRARRSAATPGTRPSSTGRRSRRTASTSPPAGRRTTAPSASSRRTPARRSASSRATRAGCGRSPTRPTARSSPRRASTTSRSASGTRRPATPSIDGKDAHDGNVTGVAFSPDGKTLLTCGRDLSVKLWDVGEGHADPQVRRRRRQRRGRSPSRRTASASWRARRRSSTSSTPRRGRSSTASRNTPTRCFAVAFLPDGRRAVSGGKGEKGKDESYVIRMWGIPK